MAKFHKGSALVKCEREFSPSGGEWLSWGPFWSHHILFGRDFCCAMIMEISWGPVNWSK